MARKEMTFKATDGRDEGKKFFITEMDAFKAESWAMRAIMALMAADIDIGDTTEDEGMAGIAKAGLKAIGKLDYAVAKPLLDEMLECVSYIPTPSKPHVKREMVAGDIEEVTTIFKLRMAILELHTGFSLATGK